MLRPKYTAFTLVELLISIAILVILSTLGFTYMSGFFSDSRDVARISDLNNMEQALEVFFIKKGYIPEPDGAIAITYDDSEIWNQGTFGQNTLRTIRQLSNKPVDPLHENEYSFSVLTGGKEYELSTIFEGDIVAQIPGINTVNAASKTAYTLGNYNKKIVSINISDTTQILALPSITASNLDEPDLDTIIDNNDLVIHLESNLPANYNQELYNQSGEVILNIDQYVIFDGKTISLNTLIQQQNLIVTLQEIYGETSDQIEQKEYISLMQVDTSNASEVRAYIEYLAKNQLGGFRLN